MGNSSDKKRKIMLKFILFFSFAFSQEIEENFDLFRNMFEANGPGSDRKIGKYFPMPTEVTETTAKPFSGLRCWKCDADSVADCKAQGEIEICDENEDSCQLEIRTRKSKLTKIKTGCKQKIACKRNQANNFFRQSFWYRKDQTQCRPETNRLNIFSVCRQCCWTDNCVNADNNLWLPATRWQWGQENGRVGV